MKNLGTRAAWGCKTRTGINNGIGRADRDRGWACLTKLRQGSTWALWSDTPPKTFEHEIVALCQVGKRLREVYNFNSQQWLHTQIKPRRYGKIFQTIELIHSLCRISNLSAFVLDMKPFSSYGAKVYALTRAHNLNQEPVHGVCCQTAGAEQHHIK